MGNICSPKRHLQDEGPPWGLQDDPRRSQQRQEEEGEKGHRGQEGGEWRWREERKKVKRDPRPLCPMGSPRHQGRPRPRGEGSETQGEAEAVGSD